MGADKALLTIDGETMLERAVRTALVTGSPVAVSGREPPDAWIFPSVPFIPDLTPYSGPMHGISRLLDHFRSPVLVIGCDMPLITSAALKWLIDQADRHNGEDGITTVDHAGVIQPLFTIYRPALLPGLEAGISGGASSGTTSELPSARAVIETGRFYQVQVPAELEVSLQSVDTPEEYEVVRWGTTSNPSSSSI